MARKMIFGISVGLAAMAVSCNKAKFATESNKVYQAAKNTNSAATPDDQVNANGKGPNKDGTQDTAKTKGADCVPRAATLSLADAVPQQNQNPGQNGPATPTAEPTPSPTLSPLVPLSPKAPVVPGASASPNASPSMVPGVSPLPGEKKPVAPDNSGVCVPVKQPAAKPTAAATATDEEVAQLKAR